MMTRLLGLTAIPVLPWVIEIKALEAAAIKAGDIVQIRLCRRALGGSEQALRKLQQKTWGALYEAGIAKSCTSDTFTT